MKGRLLSILCMIALAAQAQPFQPAEISRWEQQAGRVTVVRDNWGVPHINGPTDADVVFGMIYTQCEDDFGRVEDNYISSIGRQAEVDGEAFLYHDLRARMFLDSVQAIAIYQSSPDWMKKLLQAFAAGANYYLHKHPEVKPRLLTRFQPWMPLMFSEGSIGGNISYVSVPRIKAFYENAPATSMLEPAEYRPLEPVGSNGFAVAPSRSAGGNALLLINPHTSFYFRSELHMVSEEGLNAYGAVTWGQFFIYQGFNEHCGWMHTSSGADSMDEFLESVQQKDGAYVYRHGNKLKPVQTQEVTLPYKAENGEMKTRSFTIYRTHHGPIVGQQDGRWVAYAMMNKPLEALSQSYLRTKAKGFTEFSKVMKLRTNSSNGTVFADRKGNIAYWHGNFMPRRDPSFDWDKPVDGSNPRTDWKGLHRAKDVVLVHNPATGWLQNCNSTPFTAAAAASPKKTDFPAYMAPDAENYRGIHAVEVLSREPAFTLNKLIAAAYDPHLPAFEELIPALMEAWQQAPNPALAEAVELLKNWDKRFSAASIPTTVAIYWAEKMHNLAYQRRAPGQASDFMSITVLAIRSSSAQEKIALLAETLQELERDFGTWRMPWGEINRFQRLTGKIQEIYDDNKPSLPVAFTSATWGSLAAYGATKQAGTKKRYGARGNSFVAVVEFGPKLVARSVVTGGQDSRPGSPHFFDQGPLYAEGRFKEVRFYPEDVKAHAERTYRPGE